MSLFKMNLIIKLLAVDFLNQSLLIIILWKLKYV